MPKEIERKFLVATDAWKQAADRGTPIRQGYLSDEPGVTVRARVAGDKGYITIKGPITGISRDEFEYEIPAADAEQLVKMSGTRVVEKTRYRVEHAGHTWEVDVFGGENAGLVLAEIELSAASDTFDRPSWLGQDVSHDIRYFSGSLARNPWSRWR